MSIDGHVLRPILSPPSHLRHGECPRKDPPWVLPSIDPSHRRQAPPKRNNNASGLGRAIINKQVKDSRERHESGLVSRYGSKPTELVHLRPRHLLVYNRY